MDTATLARSVVGRRWVKCVAAAMESRLRYRIFGPDKILEGVSRLRGQAVLEVGCGTGYFTIPAARIIGVQGSLVAIDVLQDSVELVSRKLLEANLRNVRAVRADARKTGFEDSRFDAALLFGIIPAPMLPLRQLLTEMHRVLKPGGLIAVWPPVPIWLRRCVLKSGLFTFTNKKNQVVNFERREVAR